MKNLQGLCSECFGAWHCKMKVNDMRRLKKAENRPTVLSWLCVVILRDR